MADDDPRTFQHEGRGEELDPAVDEEEWYDADSDQLQDAVDMEDPVESLEVSMALTTTESDATNDATELADRAAPPAPEEEAVARSSDISADTVLDEAMTVGLPAGIDLDALSPEDLAEAELVALSEGDPETAAILADELARRGRRSAS